MLVGGIKIIQSVHCTENVEIERTLKERWLSLPWRPWIKNRIEAIPAMYRVKVPPRGYSPGVVTLMPHLEGKQMLEGQEYIVAHPQKARELEVLLDGRTKENL